MINAGLLHHAAGQDLDTFFPGPIEPDHVVLQLARFKQNEAPIIIIDEYDRIQDAMCRILMTDVIKASTRLQNNPTIILVGVAESIIKLVSDHESIHRNLVQVPMHRMSNEEIREVILSRIRKLRMKITDDAVWRITYFSGGLPFYAHSLGKYSALKAIERNALTIDEDTVRLSLADCINDVDHTIQASYTRATEKIYRKDNIFRQVLAACALTETNALGEFAANAVERPLSMIMGSQYKVSAFSFHLTEMTKTERGKVLRKTGERRTFQYHFSEPAMQPYVIMRALEENIISKEVYDQLDVKRQKSLNL